LLLIGAGLTSLIAKPAENLAVERKLKGVVHSRREK
jgi:hypothetical protein